MGDVQVSGYEVVEKVKDQKPHKHKHPNFLFTWLFRYGMGSKVKCSCGRTLRLTYWSYSGTKTWEVTRD